MLIIFMGFVVTLFALKTNMTDKAIANYNKALKIKPMFTEANYFRGYTYFIKGQFNKAIDDLKKVAKLNEDILKKRSQIAAANNTKDELNYLQLLKGVVY